jgi:glycogen(starch) synthase
VLFDIGSASWNLDSYKKELFEKSGIGIPNHDTESNDSVVFGFMAAQFIAEV